MKKYKVTITLTASVPNKTKITPQELATDIVDEWGLTKAGDGHIYHLSTGSSYAEDVSVKYSRATATAEEVK